MELQSPRPPTTVRRNPPRRAKLTTSINAPDPSTSSSAADITPFPTEDLLQLDPQPPKKTSSADGSENLKVFLRVRPLEIRPKPAKNSKAKPRGRPQAPSPKGGKSRNNKSCLVVNDSSSVTLSAPLSVFDSKRSKSELYDGFSFVFPPESAQEEIYKRVMKPLLMDFIGGKSALLAAMGPTGSGKTHTMFGSPREPGMVPLALRQIFDHERESGHHDLSRSYYLSMFEIYSERGKGEKIFDLSSEGGDLSFQQSTIKGLQEIMISDATEAEALVARGLLKRATAATSANNQSSRSQCIINIRCTIENICGKNDLSAHSAILTIADLAGAEKERKTGNQGARLLESNFINNTSMVFGLCLRSLLEHQKNPKKSFEKHFKNSLLTRYLRDYLEGKKRMTLILTVKPGEDDYLDTSFLLRQASPYMKIKFNLVEDEPSVPHQKRNNTLSFRTEDHKRRKFNGSDAEVVEHRKNDGDVPGEYRISEKEVCSEKFQKIEAQQISGMPSNSLMMLHIDVKLNEELHLELARMKRNDEVMRKFSKALWSVLKQYKNKLEESENEVRSLKETLGEEIRHVVELKKELKELRSCCSCYKCPSTEENSRSKVDVPLAHGACELSTSLSNPVDFRNMAAEHISGLTPMPIGQSPQISSVAVNQSEVLGLKGILFDATLSGDRKSAYHSPVERRSLVVESRKISASDAVHSSLPSAWSERLNNQISASDAVHSSLPSGWSDRLNNQTAASLPEVEHAREHLESLYNHSGQIPFNSDVAEPNCKDETASHMLNHLTSDCSPVRKLVLFGEDKKIDISDVRDSSSTMEDVSGPNCEDIQHECKSFLGQGNSSRNLVEMSSLGVMEMSCSGRCAGGDNILETTDSDILDMSGQVEDGSSILSSPDNFSVFVLEKVEPSDTVSSISAAEDTPNQNNEKDERSPEFKQKPADVHGIIDGKKESLGITSLTGIQPYRSCHHSYSHDIEDDERDIIHKEDSNLEEIKQELDLSLVDDEENDSCRDQEHLKNGKNAISSEALIAKKPKRRLLPASALLLKEFSGLDVEAESAKEVRGRLTALGRGRSQGSMSLVRLLTGKQ